MPDKQSAAASFLKETLAAGPVAFKQLIERAEEASIATKTLRRAKAALGVESIRPGSEIFWRLPDIAAQAANSSDLAEETVVEKDSIMSNEAFEILLSRIEHLEVRLAALEPRREPSYVPINPAPVSMNLGQRIIGAGTRFNTDVTTGLYAPPDYSGPATRPGGANPTSSGDAPVSTFGGGKGVGLRIRRG